MLAQCARACDACAGASEAARFSDADAKVGWWEEGADAAADAAVADAAAGALTVETLLAEANLTMAELGLSLYIDGVGVVAVVDAVAEGRAPAWARALPARPAAAVCACAAAAACALLGVALRRRRRGSRRVGRWLLPTDSAAAAQVGKSGRSAVKLAHD